MGNSMDMVCSLDLMGWSMRESLKVVKYVDMVRKYVFIILILIYEKINQQILFYCRNHNGLSICVWLNLIYLIGSEYLCMILHLSWKLLNINFFYFIVTMIMMYYWIHMTFCLKLFLISGPWFVFIIIAALIDKNFNEKIYMYTNYTYEHHSL